MHFVYILKSVNSGRYYIGCTENVNRRLKEHNNGKVFSTQPLRPFKLMLKQEYPTLSLARKTERKLKSFKRKDFIEKIIREGYITRADSSTGRATPF